MRPMPELDVVMVPIGELVPYEGNAKEHPREQVDQIATSITEFGFNSPILACHDEGGASVVVAGHGRLMAARQLGMSELPVIYLDHMTDEQRRAYTLVDNQLTMNSGFDFKVLNDELDAIIDISMEDFGFDMSAGTADWSFPVQEQEEQAEPEEERPKSTKKCPMCGYEW